MSSLLPQSTLAGYATLFHDEDRQPRIAEFTMHNPNLSTLLQFLYMLTSEDQLITYRPNNLDEKLEFKEVYVLYTLPASVLCEKSLAFNTKHDSVEHQYVLPTSEIDHISLYTDIHSPMIIKKAFVITHTGPIEVVWDSFSCMSEVRSNHVERFKTATEKGLVRAY